MGKFLKLIPLILFSAHLFSGDSDLTDIFGLGDDGADENLYSYFNAGYEVFDSHDNFEPETDNFQVEPSQLQESAPSITTAPQPIPRKPKLTFKQPQPPQIQPPSIEAQMPVAQKPSYVRRKRVIGSPEHECPIEHEVSDSEISSVAVRPPAAKRPRLSYVQGAATKTNYDEQHDEEYESDVESSHKPIDDLDEDRPEPVKANPAPKSNKSPRYSFHYNTTTTTTATITTSHPSEDSMDVNDSHDADAYEEDNSASDKGSDELKNQSYHCFWSDCHDKTACHDTDGICEHVLAHARNTHRDEHSQFVCKWVRCTKKYPYKASLESHVSTHIPKRFTCSVCSKKFGSTIHLKTHMKNQHGPDEKEKVTCHECHKTILKQNFKRHMASHGDERPFVCPYEGCKEAFKAKAHLESHQQTQHEGKREICDICYHTFSCPTSLRNHKVDKHAGKIHACPICGDVLANRSNMNRHIKAKHPDS